LTIQPVAAPRGRPPDPQRPRTGCRQGLAARSSLARDHPAAARPAPRRPGRFAFGFSLQGWESPCRRPPC